MTIEFSIQLMNLSIQINQMETYSKNLEDEDMPANRSNILEKLRELNTQASASLDIAKQLFDWYRLPLGAVHLKRIGQLIRQNAANALRMQERVWELMEKETTQQEEEIQWPFKQN